MYYTWAKKMSSKLENEEMIKKKRKKINKALSSVKALLFPLLYTRDYISARSALIH